MLMVDGQRALVGLALAGALLTVTGAGCRHAPPPPEQASQEPSTEGFAAVPDGSLYYQATGTGQPVVFLNGGGMDHRQWRSQVPEFSRRFLVILFDARGWGRSPAPTSAYSNVEDLAILLNHLDVDRADLVGVSAGGGIALDFALVHPDRVRALVLLAPTVGGFRWSPSFQERGVQILQSGLEGGDEGRAEFLLQDPYFIPGARGRPELTEWTRMLLLENGGIFRLDPSLSRQVDPPAIDRLEEAGAPALVILPGLDHPDLFVIADTLHARLPDAKKVTVHGAGHLFHLEEPEVFNHIVMDFLGHLND